MLKINVAEIKKNLVGESSFQFSLKPEELGLDNAELPVVGSIEATGTISNGGDVLLLHAELVATVRRQCARCLKDFTAQTHAVVDERFYPADAENLPEDAPTYQFEVVDISEALREGLLLAEPVKVLCKPDCKGLCPKCGADLNVEECRCDKRSVDPRLAVLEALLQKKD
jgi:uncharacterized protein